MKQLGHQLRELVEMVLRADGARVVDLEDLEGAMVEVEVATGVGLEDTAAL